MPRRVPDITKIHEHIGLKPTIGLPQILADVVEHERRSS
jgi:nucleoside-diphosphate-sugar epimerase